jgi:hypothetical protein
LTLRGRLRRRLLLLLRRVSTVQWTWCDGQRRLLDSG